MELVEPPRTPHQPEGNRCDVTNEVVTSNPALHSSGDHLNHTIGDKEWTDWTGTWRKSKSANSKNMTMKGTITRGKKVGDTIDVKLDLTDRELHQITSQFDSHDLNRSEYLGDGVDRISMKKNGVHIMFFGILLMPFVLLASLFVCMYFCMLTWYNIFSYYHDDLTMWHRALVCPLLIIALPFIVLITATPVAVYAAFAQVCWSFDVWKDEMNSFEKGFYGWACSVMSMEDCSPYQVIELDEQQVVGNNGLATATSEEFVVEDEV